MGQSQRAGDDRGLSAPSGTWSIHMVLPIPAWHTRAITALTGAITARVLVQALPGAGSRGTWRTGDYRGSGHEHGHGRRDSSL